MDRPCLVAYERTPERIVVKTVFRRKATLSNRPWQVLASHPSRPLPLQAGEIVLLSTRCLHGAGLSHEAHIVLYELVNCMLGAT